MLLDRESEMAANGPGDIVSFATVNEKVVVGPQQIIGRIKSHLPITLSPTGRSG